jgi:tetratricopeptide (TPR) repeat protein
MKIKSSTLTSADVYQVINEARDAELCRNLDLFREVLSTFWEDFEKEPELPTLSSIAHAELLRLCGVFLSQFGRAKGLSDYQLRAKDVLTRAAELFEAQQYSEKVAETRVSLANCYWFSGEISEYDDILRSIEAEFGTETVHPVSIQIKLNRIFVASWRQDQLETQRLIKEVSRLIPSCPDFRLRTQFQNMAGIACLDAGDLEKSIFYFKEAVQSAKNVKSNMFVAFNLNNLAFLYRMIRNFEAAHQTVNEAILILETREAIGWSAHALDTKALIHLDEGEQDKALTVIERAIQIFSEGEDYGGLTDAMWTKCLCLLRVNRFTDAHTVFIELRDMAARQIGEVAVDKFEKLLAEEVHVLRHFPLVDELSALKRSLVVKAIRQTEGHMARASKVLGLRSQQHLSQILNREFPDIYDELGIKRRARRSKGARKKEPSLDVSRLIMPKGRTYSFNFNWRGTLEPQFFYFPKYLMLAFGIKNNGIVAVMPVKSESLFDGGIVLYSYNYTFRIGRLAYDELAQIFLVDLEELIFLSDVTLIGVPIGYCRVADRHKKTMKFERLEFIIKED